MILWTLNLDPQGAVQVSWLEVEPSAGGGTQALTPALFTNSATFYGPTVTGGIPGLNPTGLAVLLRRRRR